MFSSIQLSQRWNTLSFSSSPCFAIRCCWYIPHRHSKHHDVLATSHSNFESLSWTWNTIVYYDIQIIRCVRTVFSCEFISSVNLKASKFIQASASVSFIAATNCKNTKNVKIVISFFIVWKFCWQNDYFENFLIKRIINCQLIIPFKKVEWFATIKHRTINIYINIIWCVTIAYRLYDKAYSNKCLLILTKEFRRTSLYLVVASALLPFVTDRYTQTFQTCIPGCI